MVSLTWHGHATFSIAAGPHNLLVDPFFDDNPAASMSAADVAATAILITHGHADHVSDAAAIARRTGATVIANFEIGEWLKGQGVNAEQVIGMNHGGGIEQPFGRATMTIAHHSSSLPDGSYGGNPGGYLLELVRGPRIYLAGDTCVFLDMSRIGAKGLDLAVLPIGDLFTMGPAESIDAIGLLKPKQVVPCHYNTWPPIEQDVEAWAERVRQHTAAEPIPLAPGGTHTFG